MTIRIAKSILSTVILMALTAAILISPTTSQGQTENLLLNGDFEEGFSDWNGDPLLQVATGWIPFWVTEGLDIPNNSSGKRPEFMASDSPQSSFGRAYTGQQAQLWHTKFSTAFAGIYQRVPVSTNATLRLSAWTYAWSSEGNDVLVSQEGAWARQRVGIDPTGGTDPNSPSVAWSMPTQYLDTWGQVSVETQAQADHVTIFLSAYPNFHLPQNDIYFDAAQLQLVSFNLATPVNGGGNGTGFGDIAATSDPSLRGLVLESETVAGQQGLSLQTGQINTSVTSSSSAPQAINIRPSLVFLLVLVLIITVFGWQIYSRRQQQAQ